MVLEMDMNTDMNMDMDMGKLFYLCSPLFVLILMGYSMHFETMRLQRAPLSERFLAQRTFVRSHT